MTKKIRVNVTARDIELGARYDQRFCPIAMALTRKLHTKIVVCSTFVCFKERVHFLPDAARDFIIRFDSRKKVKPFRFTLEIQE